MDGWIDGGFEGRTDAYCMSLTLQFAEFIRCVRRESGRLSNLRFCFRHVLELGIFLFAIFLFFFVLFYFILRFAKYVLGIKCYFSSVRPSVQLTVCLFVCLLCVVRVQILVWFSLAVGLTVWLVGRLGWFVSFVCHF